MAVRFWRGELRVGQSPAQSSLTITSHTIIPTGSGDYLFECGGTRGHFHSLGMALIKEQPTPRGVLVSALKPLAGMCAQMIGNLYVHDT